ncbi:MAG: hypothetical protein IJB49_00500 [Clostridia bacterium]|nr:hypothetical protein [Clostridia bacterium]
MKKAFIVILTCFVLASLFAFAVSAENAAESSAVVESAESLSEEKEEGAVEDLEITFNPAGFLTHVGKMGFGMIGIFVVIGVIVIITYLLNKISSGKKKE